MTGRLADFGRSRALLVGAAHYSPGTGLPDLPSTANNVDQLHRLLTDPRVSGFAPEHCVRVVDPAGTGDVLTPLRKLAAAAEDVLLFYFAGHGLLDGTHRELHLATAGTTPADFWTALPFRHVTRILKESPAQVRVIILDCCFSGRALRDVMTAPQTLMVEQPDAEGLYILASSTESSVSLAPAGARFTAFTGEIVDVLGGGIGADRDRISLDELYRQVYARLGRTGRPLPTRRVDDNAADLAIARNVGHRPAATARVVPAPLPRTPPGPPRMAVVGVGGGGSNAVNRMVEVGLSDVEFLAFNSDHTALLMSDAPTKLLIGRELTRGLGAGANPDVGRKSAEDHRDEISGVLSGFDLVFVVSGQGGGTGTGAAPVVADIARGLGALVVSVASRPFSFEGKRRAQQAEAGLVLLRAASDATIVIPNDRLLYLADRSASVMDAFRQADAVLLAGVRAVTDLLDPRGLVPVGFAEVRNALAGAGGAMMGLGTASGDGRTVTAAQAAVASPLLEQDMGGARTVLLSVTGGPGLGLFELHEASALLSEIAPEAHLRVGAVVDPTMGDQVRVTVVATGM